MGKKERIKQKKYIKCQYVLRTHIIIMIQILRLWRGHWLGCWTAVQFAFLFEANSFGICWAQAKTFMALDTIIYNIFFLWPLGRDSVNNLP